MKKAEMTERLKNIEAKLFDAYLEADALAEELAENQERISDDDVDMVVSFADEIDSVRSSIKI